MKKLYYVVAVIAVAAMCASCEKEVSFESSQSANEISFVIGSAVTRAAAETPLETETAMLSLGKDEETGTEFFLEETVTSLNDMFQAGPATKGTPIYTENVTTALSSFTTVAYRHSGSTIASSAKLPDATFSYDPDWGANGTWVHLYENDPWADVATNESLWFFMRNDASINITPSLVTKDSKDYGSMSFSYTSPETAAEQKDLVFASRSLTKAEAKEAKVLFYHALTAVKFRLSNDANASITSVKFTGLKNTGSCTVTPFYGEGWETQSNPFGSAAENSKSKECVTWSASGSGTFTQTFDGVYSYTKPSDGAPFADSFYAAAADKNLNDDDASLTFWFIPQTLTENVKLYVSYTAAGKTYEDVEIQFGTKTNCPTWAAGELRTYTLHADDAGITITDKVEDNVKKDIVIKNTGSIDEYIRVAVIANWVNAAGDIVAACTPALTLNSGWSKNANDGFLYLSTAVAPNATATAPFNTYAAPSPKPTGADHLVMDIAVQAIEKGSYTTNTAAWTAAAGVVF